MSLTWGLVIGAATPIPYFYSVFFITVLVHRCGRDFERCVHSLTVKDFLEFSFLFIVVLSSMAKIGNVTARLSLTSLYPIFIR